MKVKGVHHINGRGLVATVDLDGDTPIVGGYVVRDSDGASWRVQAIDQFQFRPPRICDTVGLFLKGPLDPQEGDELAPDVRELR
jgi:hypothetical protein